MQYFSYFIQSIDAGYTEERDSFVNNIITKCKEAIKLNEQTKKHFDLLCEKTFNTFTQLYKSLQADGSIETTQIFNN